jgi:ABC-type molybdenum transport system ATPase subunit/photorepair protein PhrA
METGSSIAVERTGGGGPDVAGRDDAGDEVDGPSVPHGGREGDLAVEVRGLVKSYAGIQAVRGIDLAIRRGEVFALLGPNGAGKTTTVEILEGYRTRDHREVSVLGVDPSRERAKLKGRIGIVLQSTGMDRYLTGGETAARRRSRLATTPHTTTALTVLSDGAVPNA